MQGWGDFSESWLIIVAKFQTESYSDFLYNKIANKDDNNREGVDNMASILPISDLRNYNEVLKNCRTGEPVSWRKMVEENL